MGYQYSLFLGVIYKSRNFMIGYRRIRCTTSSRLGTKSTFAVAVFRYLSPIDNTLDPQGPLSQATLHAVSMKKTEAITKKRALYMYISFTEVAR